MTGDRADACYYFSADFTCVQKPVRASPKRQGAAKEMPNSVYKSPAAGSGSDSALAAEIAALIVEALNLEISAAEIDLDAPLYKEGLGLDSIDILEVALVISKRYGFKLKDDDQDNLKIFRSLNSLAATVAERRTK